MNDKHAYRPEIDGLRAIAVIPVILFHAGFSTFSGGFVGVDVFFVISGYLITSIILRDLEAGSFSFAGFYERRARRILPALFFVVLCCLPFAWMWMLPSAFKDFMASVVSVCVFLSNMLFWRESGYFDVANEFKPLLHTWSLAVEEQFYIVFPIVMLLLFRWGRKHMTAVMIIGAILSLGLCEYLSRTHPALNFYWAPSRAWELLAGAVIARLNLAPVQWRDEALSLAGIGAILFAVFRFDGNTPMPSLWAVVPVAGTAAIIAFARPGTLANTILSQRPIVAIGLLSYSAYLWHQPLFAFARIRSIKDPPTLLIAALALGAFVLAGLTWKFVELPWRYKTHPLLRPRRVVVIGSAIAAVALIGFGIAASYTAGFPQRLPQSVLDTEQRLRINFGLNEACEGGFTLSPKCRTSDTPEIIVWGDSYAMHLVPGLLSSKPDAAIVQMTFSLCGPILGIAPIAKDYPAHWSQKCIITNDEVLSYIKDTPSLRYAVLSSPFVQYVADDSEVMLRDGRVVLGEQIVYEKFIQTLDTLKALGLKPIVFTPPPSPGFDVGRCLQRALMVGERADICDFTFARASARSKGVSDFLRKISENYAVVWLDDAICKGAVCAATKDQKFIYRDTGHFSYEGANLIGREMNFYDLLTR